MAGLKHDPEGFVDAYTNKVQEWLVWYDKWKEYSVVSRGVPGDDFMVRRYPETIKFLEDAASLLECQKNVNIMLLAAIDELQKAISAKG